MLSQVTVEVDVDGIPGHKYQLTPTLSQAIYNHSPDGFEFGFGGSGPAQLALAILIDFTGVPEYALTHYQQFKWDKLSRMAHPGGVITGEDIEKWQIQNTGQ